MKWLRVHERVFILFKKECLSATFQPFLQLSALPLMQQGKSSSSQSKQQLLTFQRWLSNDNNITVDSEINPRENIILRKDIKSISSQS